MLVHVSREAGAFGGSACRGCILLHTIDNVRLRTDSISCVQSCSSVPAPPWSLRVRAKTDPLTSMSVGSRSRRRSAATASSGATRPPPCTPWRTPPRVRARPARPPALGSLTRGTRQTPSSLSCALPPPPPSAARCQHARLRGVNVEILDARLLTRRTSLTLTPALCSAGGAPASRLDGLRAGQGRLAAQAQRAQLLLGRKGVDGAAGTRALPPVNYVGRRDVFFCLVRFE